MTARRHDDRAHLTIRLPRDLAGRLRSAANDRDTSASKIAEHAIRRHLDGLPAIETVDDKIARITGQ